jgi:hypothetical protein
VDEFRLPRKDTFEPSYSIPGRQLFLQLRSSMLFIEIFILHQWLTGCVQILLLTLACSVEVNAYVHSVTVPSLYACNECTSCKSSLFSSAHINSFSAHSS